MGAAKKTRRYFSDPNWLRELSVRPLLSRQTLLHALSDEIIIALSDVPMAKINCDVAVVAAMARPRRGPLACIGQTSGRVGHRADIEPIGSLVVMVVADHCGLYRLESACLARWPTREDIPR